MTQNVVGKFLKALYSATIAGLGALSATLDGTHGLGSLSAGQIVTIVLSALVAGGGTYGLAGWSGPVINGPTK